MKFDTSEVEDAYQRRHHDAERYAPLRNLTLAFAHERRRALVRAFNRHLQVGMEDAKLLDIGCGEGGVLLDFLWLGATPANLTGVDILQARVDGAKVRLPKSVRLEVGSSTDVIQAEPQFDIITLFLVLMTVKDPAARASVISHAFNCLNPGGLLVINDIVVNNPRNRDIRRVRTSELVEVLGLDPVVRHRLSPPPPLNRTASRSALAYSTASMVLYPVLTHRLWVFKREAG